MNHVFASYMCIIYVSICNHICASYACQTCEIIYVCAFVLHVYDYTHMLKLDDHFESYMCSYVCFLHVYDLHVYDPKHVYDAHICAFRHMTHIYDPVSRCDDWVTQSYPTDSFSL